MIRTQVQLTDDQARTLRKVAAERGVSVAAVIRQLVDEGLRAPASARSARARAAIGRFASGSNTVSRDHDRELDRAFSQ
jgi:predicted DNA-binding ribbon-helix-helix protein